jgi:hypothetical protein
MEHMVSTVQLARPLQRYDIEGLFDNADHVVPLGVTANLARVALGDIEATRAKPDLAADLNDRIGQSDRFLARGTEQMEGKARGRLGADAWQLAQLFD